MLIAMFCSFAIAKLRFFLHLAKEKPLKLSQYAIFLLILHSIYGTAILTNITYKPDTKRPVTPNTDEQFGQAIDLCRDIFSKKLYDYKPSWRMLRPSSLTDQLFIKAKRIRTLEVTGQSLVGEGILPEFMALINYGIIGLIQLEKGYADKVDMTNDEAMALYDSYAQSCLDLMRKKNHDYGEAWRDMRVSSYTDIILTKLERIKEIEDKNGLTIASEGIDSNIMDIINYSTFAVIKLKIEKC